METKNKLIAVIASLILVFGLSYAPTTNINEARANSEICNDTYPNRIPVCQQFPVNCFCEIIVTPGEN